MYGPSYPGPVGHAEYVDIEALRDGAMTMTLRIQNSIPGMPWPSGLRSELCLSARRLKHLRLRSDVMDYNGDSDMKMKTRKGTHGCNDMSCAVIPA